MRRGWPPIKLEEVSPPGFASSASISRVIPSSGLPQVSPSCPTLDRDVRDAAHRAQHEVAHRIGETALNARVEQTIRHKLAGLPTESRGASDTEREQIPAHGLKCTEDRGCNGRGLEGEKRSGRTAKEMHDRIDVRLVAEEAARDRVQCDHRQGRPSGDSQQPDEHPCPRLHGHRPTALTPSPGSRTRVGFHPNPPRSFPACPLPAGHARLRKHSLIHRPIRLGTRRWSRVGRSHAATSSG